MRSLWLVFLLISPIFLKATKMKLPKQNDDNLLFDRSIPEYETVLTPVDFDMGAALSESLQYASSDIWESDAMYSKTRFEGDIANEGLNASTMKEFLHAQISEATSSTQYNAIKNPHQLWKNGRIPYTISSQYSSYSRSLIAASMQEYAQHTCVQWVPKEANDVNYVYIYPDRGCYSMVGKMGGKQSLSLGSGCIQKGIIIHELMHAVGFFHEQSRTDRDDFITILWNNIQPGMQGQFEKYGHGTIQSLGTSYDYSSIMHYGGKAFSRNGQPTMVPKQKNAQIGQRGGFSKTDSFKINTLYGCPTTPDNKALTTTNAPSGTTPSPTNAPIYPSPPTLPPPQPIVPTAVPLPVLVCKNTRGDCDNLRDEGWCTRNPGWMRTYCPISCGFCKPPPTMPTEAPTAAPTVAPPTVSPTAPPPPPTLPPTLKPQPGGECEDLRVDCLTLVQQRYCHLSQSFMKSYCALSCGFCFKPPPTEIPAPPTLPPIVPTMITSAPIIRFTPSTRSRPEITMPPTTVRPDTQKPDAPPTPHPCKDKKHFCMHWKSAGFCEGIFQSYMKKNCPAACGFC